MHFLKLRHDDVLCRGRASVKNNNHIWRQRKGRVSKSDGQVYKKNSFNQTGLTSFRVGSRRK